MEMEEVRRLGQGGNRRLSGKLQRPGSSWGRVAGAGSSSGDN
jgi:hypothetical protein